MNSSAYLKTSGWKSYRWPGRGAGSFTFYRLTKQGLGTLEAVEAICRRWNLSGRRVSYAGLKDRHASTIQYLTIVDGPWAGHERPQIPARAGRPARPRLHLPAPAGQSVRVDLRGLSEAEMASAIAEIDSIAGVGLPNYFDDQRFGSVGYSGEFAAHAWLLGEHERALRLALAEPNPFDRSATKSEKAILRTHWGRWAEAKASCRVPRPGASSPTWWTIRPTIAAPSPG